MAIKTILLPIRDSEVADSLMETSISMAMRNNSHLDLLYVQKNPEGLIPFATLGLSASMRRAIIKSATDSATQQGNDLRQRFLALCEKHGMSVLPRGTASKETSADFLIRDGLRDELIGQYGRIADLIIVPQPYRVSPPPSSFEAALRESGRPVLMVPRGKILIEKGKRLAIGWNASKEAAQAVSGVMDNLRRAEKVYVLCSEKRMEQPINSDDVCVYLRCHGVTAETAVFSTRQQSPGEALLAKTRELHCDRLIVGGYSRAKFRSVIMGGVTGHLLEHADMPVIMVH